MFIYLSDISMSTNIRKRIAPPDVFTSIALLTTIDVQSSIHASSMRSSSQLSSPFTGDTVLSQLDRAEYWGIIYSYINIEFSLTTWLTDLICTSNYYDEELALWYNDIRHRHNLFLVMHQIIPSGARRLVHSARNSSNKSDLITALHRILAAAEKIPRPPIVCNILIRGIRAALVNSENVLLAGAHKRADSTGYASHLSAVNILEEVLSLKKRWSSTEVNIIGSKYHQSFRELLALVNSAQEVERVMPSASQYDFGNGLDVQFHERKNSSSLSWMAHLLPLFEQRKTYASHLIEYVISEEASRRVLENHFPVPDAG